MRENFDQDIEKKQATVKQQTIEKYERKEHGVEQEQQDLKNEYQKRQDELERGAK